MIITTCETIPGRELEYLGLVAASTDKVPVSVGRKTRVAQSQTAMAVLTEDITANAQALHADAVVGVRPTSVQGTNLTLVGTAVKFRL
ncbi:MAG: hypothetical protein LUC87_08745 [Clostridiales bacterium]|nr:hypothetical protein [Clostridiales bacterium]